MLKETEIEALKVKFLSKRPTASITDFKLFIHGYEKGKLSSILDMIQHKKHLDKKIHSLMDKLDEARSINRNYASQQD